MVLSGGKILRSPGVGRADKEVTLREWQLARRPCSRPPALGHAVLQFWGKPVQLKQGALRVAADTRELADDRGLPIALGGSGGRAGGEAAEVRRAAPVPAAALTGAPASGGLGRRAGAPGRRPRGAWRGSWRRPGAW